MWVCSKNVEGDRRLEFASTTTNYKNHLELGEKLRDFELPLLKRLWGHLGDFPEDWVSGWVSKS